MLGARVEGIFQELKKFLSPGSICQKVLVPQHDILGSFRYPYHKAQNSSKRFRSPFTIFERVMYIDFLDHFRLMRPTLENIVTQNQQFLKIY